MRQVNIKELRANLSRELNDLPFGVMKNGRVIGVMCTQDEYLDGRCVHNEQKQSKKGVHLEKVKIISHLKDKIKATSHTGETTWYNPLNNSILAPKK